MEWRTLRFIYTTNVRQVPSVSKTDTVPVPHGAQSQGGSDNTTCKQGRWAVGAWEGETCLRLDAGTCEGEGLPAPGQEGGSLAAPRVRLQQRRPPGSLVRERDRAAGPGAACPALPNPRACSTWAGTTSLSAQFQGEDFNGTRYRRTKGQQNQSVFMAYPGKSTDTASTNTDINVQGKINKRSCLIKVKTLFFFFRDRLDFTDKVKWRSKEISRNLQASCRNFSLTLSEVQFLHVLIATARAGFSCGETTASHTCQRGPLPAAGQAQVAVCSAARGTRGLTDQMWTQENGNCAQKRYMNVHSRITYNSPSGDDPNDHQQMRRWTKSGYPHNSVLFADKKEWSSTWHEMANPETIVLRKQPQKPHIVWFHWMKCPEKANLKKEQVDVWLPSAGRGKRK